MWPFGGSKKETPSQSSTLDEFVAPPPSGSPFAEPPVRPRSISRAKEPAPFTGFTPPPTSKNYDSEDYSNFVSSVKESPGFEDDMKMQRELSKPTLTDQYLTNPKARQCMMNAKAGMQMGATVGGCFGLLTGTMQAVKYRQPIYVPLAVVGGAASFGFFLGIGMIVRCI
eukprot:GHVN01014553.1.p1 GENE.GHVN01014553.1~~GHVN01014553.1.p1  ORF type:complete len:169 (+),score=30.44 GHVN01014553.1:39-545(+)